MQIVLGVSMTPAAVRMVLVEGCNGDGVTVDTSVFRGADDGVQQVVAAIEGTRESATEGGHRLASIGVAWTDHAQAARLRDALRARRIDDVVMVSELHAAGALAQAIGATTGAQRTAMLFLERDIATLAVVRTTDGAVVGVRSHSLHTTDAVAELQGMVAVLEGTDEPPQAVFVAGSGVDIAAVAAQVSDCTSLPVHAPDDAELALARGAALASAGVPRYEAATVGLGSRIGSGFASSVEPSDDGLTAAGITQLGYSEPLGYSAVADDDDPGDGDIPVEYDQVEYDLVEYDRVEYDHAAGFEGASEQKPFMLVGSVLATIFVVGVASLVISLVVSIRPAVEQRPDIGNSASVPAQDAPSAVPATIEAPIPVVQQAPRTVFVPRPNAPAAAVAPPASAAPAPAAPPPPVAVPAAPPTVIPAPAPVPAPVIPPLVLAPMLPALFPPVFQPPVFQTPVFQTPVFQTPVRSTPLPRYPTTTSVPTYPATPPPSAPIPAPSSSTSATYAPTQSSPASESEGSAEPVVTAPTAPTASTTPVWPLWPGSGGSADPA